MLSTLGNFILRDLYDGFRVTYLMDHPGSNENDIERAFLYAMCVTVYGNLDPNTKERIDIIR